MKRTKLLATLTSGALILCIAMAIQAGPRKLNVYMVKGQGAVSILDDRDYQNVFRNAIFAGHNLTIDLTGGSASFLSTFMNSNLVYLSLHANPNVWVIGSGERIGHVELIRSYKATRKGPGLVIVTGCSTLASDTKVNFPGAIGIQPGARKRAYIGFRTFTPGLFADRYFRVFMAQWLKPRPNGSYLTLEEARVEAKSFIQRMLQNQGPQTGKIARFAPLDASVAGWFTIVGDSSLRATDL
jgi:hypothetical protein